MRHHGSPGAGAEPAPPLRAVFDIPLRTDVDEAITRRIDVLTKQAMKGGEETDWPAVYDDAIGIVEDFLADVEADLEALQSESLDTDDPNEVKRRHVQEPRRAADRVLGDLRNGLKAASREWMDRARRQSDYIAEECVAAANKNLHIEEHPHGGMIELRIDSTWWAQYSGYVARCCDEWTQRVVSGVEGSYSAAIDINPTGLDEILQGRDIPHPVTPVSPTNEARLGTGDVPIKTADIPSTGAALMQYVRSNIMTVAIFGTSLAVIFVVFERLFGDGEAASGPGDTMLIRGVLIIIAIPISILFGYLAARKQRKKLRRTAIEQQTQVLKQFTKAEVSKALDRHRGVLERWIEQREAQWNVSIDDFFNREVEAALASCEEDVQDKLKDLRRRQQQLNERQSELRTLKGRLSSNLLFDLKKRRREWELAAEQDQS